MAKAVALLSGGLDSQLAAKLVLIQGVEVFGVHFSSVFNPSAKDPEAPPARTAAEALGVPLRTIDITEEQIEILKNPPHGFGSAANPCIDCHIFMLSVAAGYMLELGADFIVTGEVLGQRPMSQRRFSLDLIDRETGLGGRILRPLSAKELSPTIPEQEGLVDRDRLEGIKGRSRVRQMALAAQFGLTEYPSPAGGCLLTDPAFGARVKDLLEHGELDTDNARLLKLGRHYRLGPRTKAVVGREEAENYEIEALARDGDLLIVLEEMPGPTGLLRGDKPDQLVAAAAALTARPSKARNQAKARLRVREVGRSDQGRVIEVTPADDRLAAKLSINR